MPANPNHHHLPVQPSVALPLITGLTRASRRGPAPGTSTAAAAASSTSAGATRAPTTTSTPSRRSSQPRPQEEGPPPSSADAGDAAAPVRPTSSQRIVAEALRQHRAAATIGTFLRRSVEVRRTNHGIRRGTGTGGGHGGDGGGQSQSQSTKWVKGGNDKKRRRTAKTPPPPPKKKMGDDIDIDAGESGSQASGGGADENEGEAGRTQQPKKTKAAVVGTLGISQRHWAWSSLLAPSLRVRRATARLLLDGIVPPSHSSIGAAAGGGGVAAGSSVTADRLIATLLDLANRDFLLPTTTSVPGSAGGDTAHNGRRGYGMDTGGDPSLQLLGLLGHLVTEEPLLRMASERSVLDQVAVAATSASAAGGGGRSVLALSPSPSPSPSPSSLLVSSAATLPSPSQFIESDRSIESFVASGGLRWVSASLLRVVVELTTRAAAAAAPTATDQGGDDMELLTGTSSSPRPCGGSDETELETLQARLVALVDLLYRIVLYAGLTHRDYWKVASQSSASAATASTGAATPAATTPSSPPLSAMVPTASITMESRQNSTLLDKSRQKRRQDALTKVLDLLWSSTVPALSVITGSGGAAAKLSPLACVVASHELLKTGSSDGGSPYLSGRNRGLDRALACLSRIVDVSATVSVQLPTAASTSSATTASASNKRGGSSRSSGGSTADRALGASSRATSLSTSRAARRRRLTSRRSNPYAAGASGSNSAAAQRAYSNSLASSLLGLASPSGAEADPFAAAGFGSPDSSSSAAVARSVSAAMSALDRARSRGSAGGALSMELDDIDDSDDDDDRINHGGDEQQRSQPQHGDADGDSDDDDDDDDNAHRNRDEEDPDAAYDRETDMEGQGEKDDEDDDDEEIPSDDEDMAPARSQPIDMEIDEPFDESLVMLGDDGPAGLHASEVDAAAARAMAAAAVAASAPASSGRLRITSPGAPRGGAVASAATKKPSAATKAKRKSAYLKTGMSLLEAQHPSPHYGQRSAAVVSSSSCSSIVLSPPILTTAAEQSLLKSMCDIVRPQKKPVSLKMFLRRAPTQEEFFRGNLTRNPVSLAHLTKNRPGASSGAAAGGAGQGSGGNEPTVRDLRDHIAKDLQVSQRGGSNPYHT